MYKSINNLNKKITKCTECERLVFFRQKIAKEKRKQYINDTYWGKPINGYGDILAQLLIIGLAPAAHGGNRTGRVFTGDKSADFLFKCLYKVKLANQPSSVHRNDGLKLYNTYLTTALKCVPPEDKPTSNELKVCSKYLNNEIFLLKNINTILALGKIGFDSCIKFYKEKHILRNKDFVFYHGCNYILPDKKILIGSYHPSPRNVNTGRINLEKMEILLNKTIKLLKRTK